MCPKPLSTDTLPTYRYNWRFFWHDTQEFRGWNFPNLHLTKWGRCVFWRVFSDAQHSYFCDLLLWSRMFLVRLKLRTRIKSKYQAIVSHSVPQKGPNYDNFHGVETTRKEEERASASHDSQLLCLHTIRHDGRPFRSCQLRISWRFVNNNDKSYQRRRSTATTTSSTASTVIVPATTTTRRRKRNGTSRRPS